jgi:hypothetical protein
MVEIFFSREGPGVRRPPTLKDTILKGVSGRGVVREPVLGLFTEDDVIEGGEREGGEELCEVGGGWVLLGSSG